MSDLDKVFSSSNSDTQKNINALNKSESASFSEGKKNLMSIENSFISQHPNFISEHPEYASTFSNIMTKSSSNSSNNQSSNNQNENVMINSSNNNSSQSDNNPKVSFSDSTITDKNKNQGTKNNMNLDTSSISVILKQLNKLYTKNHLKNIKQQLSGKSHQKQLLILNQQLEDSRTELSISLEIFSRQLSDKKTAILHARRTRTGIENRVYKLVDEYTNQVSNAIKNGKNILKIGKDKIDKITEDVHILRRFHLWTNERKDLFYLQLYTKLSRIEKKPNKLINQVIKNMNLK